MHRTTIGFFLFLLIMASTGYAHEQNPHESALTDKEKGEAYAFLKRTINKMQTEQTKKFKRPPPLTRTSRNILFQAKQTLSQNKCINPPEDATAQHCWYEDENSTTQDESSSEVSSSGESLSYDESESFSSDDDSHHTDKKKYTPMDVEEYKAQLLIEEQKLIEESIRLQLGIPPLELD